MFRLLESVPRLWRAPCVPVIAGGRQKVLVGSGQAGHHAIQRVKIATNRDPGPIHCSEHAIEIPDTALLFRDHPLPSTSALDQDADRLLSWFNDDPQGANETIGTLLLVYAHSLREIQKQLLASHTRENKWGRQNGCASSPGCTILPRRYFSS